MYKTIVPLIGLFLISACTNQNYNLPKMPSPITGFYSASFMFITAINTQALELREDGSGFQCTYGSQNKVTKTPVKHIGGNVWASATFGTAEIIQNSDGSITWGGVVLHQTRIEDTMCQ